MPTYDYNCTTCGRTFELFQAMSEKPKRKCLLCGALTARRLIGSGGAVIFRGSGFYQTDYRSKEYKDQAKAEKSSQTPASSEAGSSKAAAKPSGQSSSDA